MQDLRILESALILFSLYRTGFNVYKSVILSFLFVGKNILQ